MEFLCVVAGKHVWSVRVDLHILDNGGNLIDAANIAALAALSTFWRPECTVGGDDGQQVTVHDPEVRDPLPLTIHHMPIAVTFAYFGEGNIVVLDPTYKEEAVMGGRMTAIVNSNGDVCAIQKAGGEGLMSSVTMQCLRIASVKATDITSKIKKAVLIWDVEAQPNRHAVLGSSESRPDLILTGHKENAEFALAMCPAEPYVLSGDVEDEKMAAWKALGAMLLVQLFNTGKACACAECTKDKTGCRDMGDDGDWIGVNKGFNSDAVLAMETIHSLSASKSSYPMADLTQLFMTATQEGKRSESQGQILRVVSLFF
ncbi:Exosome complex component RRP45B [Zea mays]|uniref:Exosome complex component RRP45B n=1 Tax=Zea mays TaxID=4577 RepID=A0A1R3MJK5_MAIZE|nr:Exosome complex component RRP45B [Zea mays]